MKKEIKVGGMHCPSCEILVSEALEALDGVQKAQASHQCGVVEVEYDPAKIDDEVMKRAIEGEGYTVAG
ncbi:MAG TPA: copper chaperone [Chlorobaculum parvum]|uniref:Copper chaperone n=1 Tax=Chlorobaculum parvum TaxID=274539 RepID=A0A7C5DCM3_9CHLB|nr:copper chaperone [Chlorobaculum parvum]